MPTMGRRRFGRSRRRPAFNRLTMNVEFARALGEGDGLAPRRTLEPPAHEGVGTERVPKSGPADGADDEKPRGKAPGPMH